MKPVDMIQNNKYVNCTDLDAPEIFVIMDLAWARANEEAISNTKGVEGLNTGMGIFYIFNPHDRLLFAMRWP